MARDRYNVVIVQPREFAVAPAVWDVGRLLRYSFESLGAACTLQVNGLDPGAINIVLGYQWLDGAAPKRYPMIVYQLEQLSDREGWFNEKRLEILIAARDVWDYSRENVEFLRQRGVPRVKVLPMGFHERLRTIAPAAPDIDVLFYGLVNQRRQEALQRLESRCRLAAVTGVFGAERDALIARSKIVLNLHFYEKCILEQTRVSYLLNNGCCVVSEESTSNPYQGMIATAPREKVADLCLELLGDPARREALRTEGFERFRGRPMTEHLKAALADDGVPRESADVAGVPAASGAGHKHTANPMDLSQNAAYYNWERPEVVTLLQQQGVKAGAAIELGCAAGGLGAGLKAALGAAMYVGVELSEQAALKAASRLDRVVVADLERAAPRELGLEIGGFDLLVALDVLEHLVNPWDTLAAWSEALKPGGHAVASMPNVQNIEILQGLAAGRWDYAGAGLLDVTHLRFFTKRSIEPLLAGAGLRVVRMECLLKPQPDMSSLRDTGNSLTFHNVTINNLTRDDVIQLLTHQYLILAQKT